MAAGKRIESSKILKSIHMSNSEFKGFQIGAESWEVRKKCGESDLIIQWFEDLMTWWFKSFPATVQNGRFLGQNCSRNISNGAVLTPLFGPAWSHPISSLMLRSRSKCFSSSLNTKFQYAIIVCNASDNLDGADLYQTMNQETKNPSFLFCWTTFHCHLQPAGRHATGLQFVHCHLLAFSTTSVWACGPLSKLIRK